MKSISRALRNSLNESLLASPIINNSSMDFNGDYGRQSLDALAAAAIQASTNNKVANLVSSLSDANGSLKEGADDADKWMVVGVFKTLTQNVTNYVDYQWETSLDKLTSENLPDLSMLEKIPLEQGRAYRFRIAGVNACGVGSFSEVRTIEPLSVSMMQQLNISAFIIQNMSAWLPWGSIRHKNLKILRRSTSLLGATEHAIGRNHRILGLPGGQRSEPIEVESTRLHSRVRRAGQSM